MTTTVQHPPKVSSQTGILSRLAQLFRQLQERESREVDGLAIVSRMTFLLLIGASELEGTVHKVLVGLCVVGFMTPALYLQSWLWLAISGTLLCGYLPDWFEADNHKYLMTYWCLVMLICTFVPAQIRGKALAFNGRWLIFLCFLFTVVWKVSTPNYRDGSFFTLTLLTDPRFQSTSTLATDLTHGDLEHSLRRMDELKFLSGNETSIVLLENMSPDVRRFAFALTWFTLLLEFLIALCFFPIKNSFCARLRDGLLLVFGVGVYAATNVMGFGQLLMAMGYAQCEKHRRRTRAAYVAVFFLIYIYGLLWTYLPA